MDTSKFINTFNEAKQLLNERNLDAAKAKYYQLLDLYRDIALSNADPVEKELAHEQVLKIYYGLQNPPKFKVPAVSIVVLVLIVTFLFFFKPSIVGLFSFPQKVIQPVNLELKNGTYTIALKGVPLEFKATGSVTGNVKIFLVKDKELIKVVDASEDFYEMCVDSCSLDYGSSVAELLVQVEGSALLDKVIYKAKPLPNNKPEYKGPGEFQVSEAVKINLTNYFVDADGDALVYLVTAVDGFDVSIVNEVLEVKPDHSGLSGVLSIVASDTKDIAKVAVMLKS